mmetsp:Transcript_9120/g.19097  ORF Transcript_9120/g.19097 Transcript_9120/m.19097 type:complete len:253 (+) Transcript_9120:289-1047(+)
MGPRLRGELPAHPPLVPSGQVARRHVPPGAGAGDLRLRLRRPLFGNGHLSARLGDAGQAVRERGDGRFDVRFRHAGVARGGEVQLPGHLQGSEGVVGAAQVRVGGQWELQGGEVFHRLQGAGEGQWDGDHFVAEGAFFYRIPPAQRPLRPPPPPMLRLRHPRLRILRRTLDAPIDAHLPLPPRSRNPLQRIRLAPRIAQAPNQNGTHDQRHPEMRRGVPLRQPTGLRRREDVLRRMRHDRGQREDRRAGPAI